MAVIANLDINLNARTRKFNSNVKKSGGIFSAFTSRVGKFGVGNIAGLLGLTSAAASAAVAIANVNKQFGKIDDLAKTADAIGANVGELQALRLQGELTGASIGNLDKGIARFTRVLGDARAGDALAIQSFKELGLAANDFDGLTLTQQVGKVSDAINDGETAADRASRAYAIFGRQGQELQNFFAGGSEGIEAAADDLDRLGATLTRVDAAKIEQMNDSFTRLSLVSTSLWQNLAVESAPVIEGLVEMFTDAAAEAGGFGSVAEVTMSILTTGIGFALDGWNVFMGAWKAGQALTTSIVASIVENLALVESGLMKLGGNRFDFGLGSLAEELNKEAEKLAQEASTNFSDGFSGKLSSDLKNRITEIKREAEQTATAVAEKIAPPVIAPPDPSALIDFGQRFSAALGVGLNSVSLDFLDKPEEATQERTSVTALARGSSAAQSFINRQREENKTQTAIEKAAEKNEEQLIDANVSLSEIATSLADGGATLVSLAGF